MTDKIAILEKIIHVQSCIIEGHSLKSILRKETPFFKESSGAEIITVCMETEDHVDIEIVLEEQKKFLALLRKYNLAPKQMNLQKFIEQCSSHFSSCQEHIKLKSMYDIFEGTLSKKKSTSFEEEMGFVEGDLFPIRNKTGKKIGFVIYFFTKEPQKEKEKLLALTEVFQLLVRPFYDEKLHILHAKCVQIDEKMQRLTDKERQIAHRVLLGRPHKIIAEEMGISINTLKTHMKNIFSKYEVSSKIELHNKLTGSV